jgi:hypothetical protein
MLKLDTLLTIEEPPKAVLLTTEGKALSITEEEVPQTIVGVDLSITEERLRLLITEGRPRPPTTEEPLLHLPTTDRSIRLESSLHRRSWLTSCSAARRA